MVTLIGPHELNFENVYIKYSFLIKRKMAASSDQQGGWSLGLSDEENDLEADANKIIENGDGKSPK